MTSLKHIAGTAALGTALPLGAAPFSSQAQAGYVVTLQEVGSDVIAIGGGPIDLTGLSFDVRFLIPLVTVHPAVGEINIGPWLPDWVDRYTGVTGPTSFGSGSYTLASSGGGDQVGIGGVYGDLLVPVGYISGAPLSNSVTFLNHSFATLGVDPGTYVWSWGEGENQNFTLIIGAVPEPASAALLGMALAGLLLAGTRRRNRSDA